MLRYKVNNTESHRTYHMLQQSSACKFLLCVYLRYFLALFFCFVLLHFRVLAWHNLTPACLTIKESKNKAEKKNRKELPVSVIRQSRRRLQISPDFTLQFPCGCKVRKCGSSTYCAAVRAACVVLQVVFHFDCVSYMLHTLNNGRGGGIERRWTEANDWKRPGNCTSGTYANRSGPAWDVVGDLRQRAFCQTNCRLQFCQAGRQATATHRTRA